MKILTERVYSLTAAAEREIARDVNEKPCYICLDLDTEHNLTAEKDKEKTYEPPDENFITVGAKRDTSFQGIAKCDVDIREKTSERPDGNIITVGAKRFRCAEVRSQPSFTGNESQRSPRHLFLEQYEMWRPHPKGVLL